MAWYELTQDSDIITEMQLEHIQPFVSALQGEFFMDDEMIADAIRQNSNFNILHRETMFKVDIFIPSPHPFQTSQLVRAQRQAFDLENEMSANFASAEDTILSKLDWYRLGNETSERQWRDILGILKTRAGELDVEYLKKWAKDLNVADLLERAVQQSR